MNCRNITAVRVYNSVFSFGKILLHKPSTLFNYSIILTNSTCDLIQFISINHYTTYMQIPVFRIAVDYLKHITEAKRTRKMFSVCCCLMFSNNSPFMSTSCRKSANCHFVFKDFPTSAPLPFHYLR